MFHDRELLDRLSACTPIRFDGKVFRATPKSLDPLTPSVSGGRWAPKNTFSILYTSCEKEGAIAELAFHWAQFNPLPSKPAYLHHISVTTGKTLRLLQADLELLGVDWTRYGETNNQQTQKIGAAVAFLECDGLIAPSARWERENLMLFSDHHDIKNSRLEAVKTEEIDWLRWAREHGMV